VMSDLRECVTGDTLVCLTDGRRVPIRELVGATPEVWAVNERRRTTRALADKVWCVGRRPIFRIQLASGRYIRATAEHRLLAAQGWTRISELKIGDRLALSRRVPEPAQPQQWPEHWLILLGHLVGDGSYVKHQPLRYTTASEDNSRAVRDAAEAFGCRVTRCAGRGAWHQLVIAGNGNRWSPAGVGAWLKELGIFGQRSHEKHLPSAVFTLADEQVALLVRHLWATDGSVTLRKPGTRGAPRVYFASVSAMLARDVAALLLRLGIVARIRTVHGTSGRPTYTVDVSGSDSQKRFVEVVGGFGPRVRAVAELGDYLARVVQNTNVDTLPEQVMQRVCALMNQQGIRRTQMAALRGYKNINIDHAPSRKLIAEYAAILKDEGLQNACESDLFWDRVVATDAAGEENVYDLTVPDEGSWLADGIVSHNSGAIEQDADLILFIYREEVYERDTPRKGIADIIIAKQRNGPVGDFRLTFLGQFTRFENLVAEAYGAGVF
jgi:replicative DNA helicase